MREWRLYTGSYTEPIEMGDGSLLAGRGEGIDCYAFDGEKGVLRRVNATMASNPSYVLADPNGPYLYCVNELKRYGEVDGSTVTAYRRDDESGAVTLINRQATCGADACHLSLSPDGRHLMVANYSGGSFCVLPRREDGGLEPMSCLFRHCGHGPNADRQEGPHPHQSLISPDGAYVYISDLGLDRLACYRAVWDNGWLIPVPTADIPGRPGQGLRHGAFSADWQFLYVMAELSSEVNAYRYASGCVELLQTLPCGAGEPTASGAGIRIHPSGKWLYCGVRGANRIAVFEILPDGRLEPVQSQLSGGLTPRDFTLSPDGRWLLAGHQDSDDICVHRVDPDTGRLTLVHRQEGAMCVTCLCFIQ